MQKYSEFAPTGFDHKGAFLSDQQDWLVLPVSRNRDDGQPLTESNFETALEILGGERENICEVHRFGHWGPGWFEIIIINPRAGKTLKRAEGIENNLADYPVLNEEDFSQREYEAETEYINDIVLCDIQNEIDDRIDTLFDKGKVGEINIDDYFKTVDILGFIYDAMSDSDIYPEHYNDGPHIDIDALSEALDWTFIDMVLTNAKSTVEYHKQISLF
jgi:hypothetical protein